MKAFKLGIKVAAVAGLTALLSISASAAIKDSKHDLRGTASTVNGGTKIENATEICAFCHTPHGSSAATEAPLWNKVLAAGVASTYNGYESSTLDGAVLLAGSPSLACLSCHDGSQAMNTVINAPSVPGNYNYAAGGASYGTSSTAYKMTEAVANLTKDLRNDHPVAIPYAGGGWSVWAGTTGSQSTFVAAANDVDFLMPNKATIGTEVKWWVEANGDTDTRTKTDLILYNRAGGEAVAYVECATCHDPHAGESQSFLRMGSNDESKVCLACHIK